MRLIFTICVLALLSCAPDPIPIPACDHVHTRYDGLKAHLIIDSTASEVTICRDYGRCTTYSSHYFHCISISADPGEMITVITGDDTCTITIPIINNLNP